MKIESIPINKIVPNPNQVRKTFNEETIKELAESIKNYGLLQPIAVTKYGTSYSLVSGERRLRACQLLGWVQIPAIVKNVDESGLLIESLIENLQRENLPPLERAEGIKSLILKFNPKEEPLQLLKKIESKRKINLNSEEISALSLLESMGIPLGKAITLLQVVDMPDVIKNHIGKDIKFAQAEDLSRLDKKTQKAVYQKVKKEKLGVAGTKGLVDKVVTGELDRKTLKPKIAYDKNIINLVRNGAMVLKDNVNSFISQIDTFPTTVKNSVLGRISELMVACEELATKIEGEEESGLEDEDEKMY